MAALLLGIPAATCYSLPNIGPRLVRPTLPARLCQARPSLSIVPGLIKPSHAQRSRLPLAVERSELFLTKEVSIAGVVCAICLRQLSISTVPSMLALHVACMSLMLPLGVAGVSSIRRRKAKPKQKPVDAAARKRRVELYVIRHFVASAFALYGSAAGMVAIFRHTATLGRPHLRTPHSWVGVGAFLLWLAAYFAAQPHVWRDQIRERRFSLLTNKRWLWADVTHRRLGNAAVGASLMALSSGMLSWRALDQRVAWACCVCLTGLGFSTFQKPLANARTSLLAWAEGWGQGVLPP
eukprot:CAMPEP_0183335900 /NCGR_PEP_ID=MMETSP0164_2-20130417/4046_1 /TAXON_ID=221442 /ORGANISM="Coccolithus pelagicus ssp braarudi, Strain PLY182g" /LENGTH=294 /DNA_ID=CAMNT_0025505329 /DNA_START=12 /DNA_END=896 /DNA_ORIENTATION=+